MANEILIAGAGIGGLAAALALARKGRTVRVLEKAPELGEIGYGIQVGPNAHRMLEHLGVMDALEPSIVLPESLLWMDAVSGREIARLDLNVDFRARYRRPYFVVHRRDLHGALESACRALPAVTIETSKGVASFEQGEDRVIVRCEDGSTYEGLALIGADGLHSVVRATIAGDGAPRVSGHVAYRGVVPVESIADKSHANAMVMWVGHDLHLVQYRLRGGTVMNNVAVIESRKFKRGEKIWGDAAELEEIFAPTVPTVRSMLALVGKDRNWVLVDREPISQWTKGRATLLGDAAHPTLQYLAQGACMAIEDACVLAEKVDSAGGNFEQAFNAYQQERFLRCARVVLTSRAFGSICHAGGTARELRNHLCPRNNDEAYRHTDWIYQGISLG
jgi:3-hydroxybenzoate 6-monooxygenase